MTGQSQVSETLKVSHEQLIQRTRLRDETKQKIFQNTKTPSCCFSIRRIPFQFQCHVAPITCCLNIHTHTHTPVTPFPPAVRVRLLEIPLLLQHTFHIPEYSGISTPISNNICDHTVCIHRHTNTHTPRHAPHWFH